MLARYKVLRELGRGAMGAVYAAQDRTTGAVVALKRLDPALPDKSDAQFVARFLRHARSARLLKHPNIVETYDAGEAGGTAYVAMEMLEGESLRSILDRGPLPIARAIRIAHDIASGLAHAHLQGVVHGGLKPSNVIVLRSGTAKITDFGIGQADPNYISPEQLRGEAVDHRCDVFSLGALLYEMLTGRPPSQGNSPPPGELNPHVPRALDAIVLSLIAAEPAGRMAGMPLLVRDLQRLAEGLGLGSAPSTGAEEPAAPAPPARPPATEEPRHSPPTNDPEVFDYHAAIAIMERESRAQRSSRSRPAIFAAFALALAALGIGVAGFLGVGVTGLMDRVGLAGWVDDWVTAGKQRLTASRLQEAPAPAPAAPAPDPVPPQPPTTAQPAPRPVAAPPVAEMTQEPVTAPAPQPVPPQPLAAEPGPLQQTKTAQVTEQQPAATARLVVAVSPRGELYIDGKHHGTTPPITTFDLEPGMRQIEIRSGSRKPYLTYMVVQPGDVRRIRHDFNAKPIRPR